ncbi:MAG: endonuclease III domain-containing protein [Desulfuromonadales bacterium]|nr:endonuclease III domain-containing protein [Desulfuromonadales bacterium]
MSDQTIRHIQRRLHEHFGALHWWPAESPFEVAVGAILTQNTAWTNVEQAIRNLKRAEALAPQQLAGLPVAQLEELIRPSGFFRQKALRLQSLARHLQDEWQGSLANLCSGPLPDARARLLSLPGIGPETADSILLYAADRPSFVVDAYTRRIFERIGLLQGQEKYDEIRQLFMQNLPEDAELYNEYHAQIVQLAKTCCRKHKTLCSACPLNAICRHAKRADKDAR